MEENDIHDRLSRLVDEEHELRERLAREEITPEAERARVREIEIERDQLWDLLRQREALREAGRDPNEAQLRPPGEVEGYLQ